MAQDGLFLKIVFWVFIIEGDGHSIINAQLNGNIVQYLALEAQAPAPYAALILHTGIEVSIYLQLL
ncbi:hypothetical protein [Azospirillum sp. B4]|uniref:hypothetical protein n=1 Tax=Azospirillum sp. B4 TaxID=95605 RepID=UPI0011DD5E2B|nr:hypothetical protein [Azospirillum sp. B4]